MNKKLIKINDNDLVTDAILDKDLSPDDNISNWIILGETEDDVWRPELLNEIWNIPKLRYTGMDIVDEENEIVLAFELNRLKKKRIKDLSITTTRLVEQGFVFTDTTLGIDIRLGANSYDQTKWNTLIGLKDVITYPLENTVKDWDGNYYTINNIDHLIQIVFVGMAHVTGHTDSHKVLKDQIELAKTISEVNTIVDERG